MSGTETELKFLLLWPGEAIERSAAQAGTLVSRRLIQQRYLDASAWKLRAKRTPSPTGAIFQLCLRDAKRNKIALTIDARTWELLGDVAVAHPARESDAPGTERLRIDDLSAWTVRFRRNNALSGTDIRCFLTMKRKKTVKTSLEIECRIPPAEHETAIGYCGPALFKRRVAIQHLDHTWEIDTFMNPELDGLEIAEVELASEAVTPAMPRWAGKDVTADKRYKNATLARRLAA